MNKEEIEALRRLRDDLERYSQEDRSAAKSWDWMRGRADGYEAASRWLERLAIRFHWWEIEPVAGSDE